MIPARPIILRSIPEPTFSRDFAGTKALNNGVGPAITFSRGSNATYFDSTGTLQYAPNNLMAYSASSSNWSSKSNVTITSGAITAPDGTQTGDLVTGNSGNNSKYVRNDNSNTSATNFVASVYVKYSTEQYVVLRVQDTTGTNGFRQAFDLTANGGNGALYGSIAYGGTGVGTNAAITPAGNGWLRISVAGYFTSKSNTSIASEVWLNSYASVTSTTSFYVWGLQCEAVTNATTPSIYYPTSGVNQLPYSNDLTQLSYWFKSNYTASLSGTGIDGNPVTRLVETATNNTHFVYSFGTTASTFSTTITSGQSYTFSAYIKKGIGSAAPDWVQLSNSNSNFTTCYANFNLFTGQVGNFSGFTSATMTPAGNGWYRCVATATATSSTTAGYGLVVVGTGNANVSTRLPSYLGDVNADFYIGQTQMEIGSVATPYNATPSVPYYGPRFDTDPATLQSKGLLIEEQRVNYMYQSTFSSSWTVRTGYTLTTNSTTSPDGTTNAALLTNVADLNTTEGIWQNTAGNGNVAYTVSVWAKSGSISSLNLIIKNAASDTVITNSVFTLTSKWTRYSLTGTTTGATTGIRFEITTNGVFGNIYIYGAQVEAGAFATSYIPTGASTATRNADLAQITGSDFTNFYNPFAGTFLITANRKLPSGIPSVSYRMFDLSGTLIQLPPSSQPIFTLLNSYSQAMGNTYPENGSIIKCALTYDISSANGVNSGYLGSGTITGTLNTSLNGPLVIGNRSTLDRAFNGWINSFVYYKNSLNNQWLYKLTV